MTEPNELLRRIAEESDTKAFAALYKIMQKELFYFSLSIVKLKEPAEEITADVFINLWERRHLMQQGKIRNCPVYLLMCVKNASLNYLRSNKRPVFLGSEHFFMVLWKPEATPEELLIAAEMSKYLNRAIGNLPLQCRNVFYLVKVQGMSYKEAATHLNVSEKTVENQINIAFRKIRHYINPSLRALPTETFCL